MLKHCGDHSRRQLYAKLSIEIFMILETPRILFPRNKTGSSICHPSFVCYEMLSPTLSKPKELGHHGIS
jgi:hypothetical protein